LPSPAAKRAEAKQAAQGQDFIMACVGNDNDLREVVPGEGRRAFTGVSKGAFVVVHTTALAEPRQNSSALLQPELTMLSPFASTHSKVAEQQVIRTFVTRCHRVDAFPVQIEDAEQTRLIEAHVGLNALQRVFVHKKRSLHRANVPPNRTARRAAS
jgi:hypothetical protein